MAWVGRLEDVAPDGSASLITQGWLRASFRYVDPARSRPGDPYLPDDRDTPVTIGETTLYRMDIWDTAYTLAPGHSLRLWFSSSDSPTHEPLEVAGRNLIFHSTDFPSQLLLGTATPGASCTNGPASCPSTALGPSSRSPRLSCPARIVVRVPRSLRRVHAIVAGRAVRVTRRGGHSVVVLRPRRGARFVSVRYRGIGRRGRRVTITRRYAVCR
jgi:hypothetical protein